MDRRTLQGLAKNNKLSQYGVKGNSSSDHRDALRQQKRDNAAQAAPVAVAPDQTDDEDDDEGNPWHRDLEAY